MDRHESRYETRSAESTDPIRHEEAECSPDRSADYVIVGRPATVRDMPARLRPREELERVGVRNVSDAVLLAVLLRSGVRGTNVVDLAHRLIEEYGSLSALASASVEELATRRGVGSVKAQVLTAALELARRLNEEKAVPRPRVRTPGDVEQLLRDEVRGLDHEVFWSLPLDAKNGMKSAPIAASHGLLDASLVHPREVFREAIRMAAAAVVVAHNHPSGDPSPSAEDIRVTKQLIEAGRIVDIKVLDHVILGRRGEGGTGGYFSMREQGIATFG